MILDTIAENRGVQVEFYNRFQYTVEVSAHVESMTLFRRESFEYSNDNYNTSHLKSNLLFGHVHSKARTNCLLFTSLPIIFFLLLHLNGDRQLVVSQVSSCILPPPHSPP